MWHVLTTDKSLTLCGVEKSDQPGERVPTDRHCLSCMHAFQAAMASAKS